MRKRIECLPYVGEEKRQLATDWLINSLINCVCSFFRDFSWLAFITRSISADRLQFSNTDTREISSSIRPFDWIVQVEDKWSFKREVRSRIRLQTSRYYRSSAVNKITKRNFYILLLISHWTKTSIFTNFISKFSRPLTNLSPSQPSNILQGSRANYYFNCFRKQRSPTRR